MKAKLSARVVKGLEVRGKAYEVFDSELTGFLLRVEATGTLTYYLAYTVPDTGRRGRYRIGTTGSVSAEQARDVAKLKAAEVVHGKDVHAEKARKVRERALDRNRTLKIFLDDIYAPWAAQHQSRTTDTVRRVKTAFPDLLTRSMLDITPWVLEKWRTEQKKAGKAATTVNREMNALKGVITKAVEWDYLPYHPIPRGKVKAEKTDDQGKVRYLSREEEARLRAALDDRDRKLKVERANANTWRQDRGYELFRDLWASPFADYLKPMVLLALNTGMRRGELFKLTWQNVDLSRCTLTVEGKTAKSKKTRHVPLNAEALLILKRWHEQATGTQLVFPNAEGKQLDNVQTSWENLMRNAKIKAFRFHDLRHSFASKLAMAGVDLNTIRELLGHSDIKMTLRYSHLAAEHKADAVARLVAK